MKDEGGYKYKYYSETRLQFCWFVKPFPILDFAPRCNTSSRPETEETEEAAWSHYQGTLAGEKLLKIADKVIYFAT